MDNRPPYPTMTEQMTSYYERAVRIMTRFAIAFGLSTLAGIGIGFAVTDNVLAQIFVTVLAALALWVPFVVGIAGFEKWRATRRVRLRSVRASPSVTEQRTDTAFERDWQRLVALAPAQRERLRAIKLSIDNSRVALGTAHLDPDAHDLCVLIDRRLPELVAHELEDLPPDDSGRRRQVGELIDLVEQFARHCSRQRDGVAGASGSAREAAILRRRFEARLADHRDGL